MLTSSQRSARRSLIEERHRSIADYDSDLALLGSLRARRRQDPVSVHLGAYGEFGLLWLRDHVPETYGDCPTGVCGFYRCVYHLWRDDSPPGRPGLSSVPRDARGHTIATPGDLGPRPTPTLIPRWLESPVPESCALRVADAGTHDLLELAEYEGRHRTLVGRVLRSGLRKLKAAGVGAEELRMLIPEKER